MAALVACPARRECPAYFAVATEQKANRIRTVAEVIEGYLKGYEPNHRPSGVDFATLRLRFVDRLLGYTVLSDVTEERMREYIRQRQAEGTSGRTINMELGELSRAIGRHMEGLWPRVKKLERRKDVGRAISVEEQGRVFDTAATLRSPLVRTALPLLMLTGMCSGEALSERYSHIRMAAKREALAAITLRPPIENLNESL